jgi:hypothetical protein
VCRTALFVTVQEHFIAYCMCREAVKLFRFLLSAYKVGEGPRIFIFVYYLRQSRSYEVCEPLTCGATLHLNASGTGGPVVGSVPA